MVKHIIFWKLKEENKEENAQGIRTRLEGLVGVVPGLMRAEVRFPFNNPDFDVCLYSEFESRVALDGYQEHPAHVMAAKFVRSVVVNRICCDYEA
ncbi:Dabb family protein [Akkermansia muciniphila]|uniref:Dabb family protein n=1 Tax=Akkermansia muciniphila TaxID=239935 RepID=UPI00122F76FE|nr:Dabb family protein [Akkermansia muciniphila]KAA3387002.1 Dabb family protein [Akkermansia muciniphila]